MRENREIVLSEEEIQNICNDIGKKLSLELKNEEKTPLFLGVMKGALNFMFDLIKRIDRPIFTDFIQISSYAGVQTTGRINLKKDFDMDIKGHRDWSEHCYRRWKCGERQGGSWV